MKTRKILAIGNSFSQDATRWLQAIDGDLFVRNLFIGGCSLERHYDNIVNDKKAYAYEENAEPVQNEYVSVREALLRENWDVITVQQVSGLSGQVETYEPYITELLAYIKAYCPNAEIFFHQTWAYDEGSQHPEFGRYGHSPDKMDECIGKASAWVAEKHGLPVIRTGEFIRRLRNSGLFRDTPLYRDKFHLSLNEGRFAAAVTWDYYIQHRIPDVIPPEIDRDTAEKILAEWKKTVRS